MIKKEEIKDLINEFSESWFSSFSKLVPSNQWGNRQVAEKYLNKYWLSQEEYLDYWLPLQDEIFFRDRNLPDLVYRIDCGLIVLRGGCLFTEIDFRQLQNVMNEIGEKYFVIIQHSNEFTEKQRMFRMKFPVNISWGELTSGNYISAILLEMNYNSYYVFGESAVWGKYSANDYSYPIDMIGFKLKYSSIFQKQFVMSSEESKEIRKWLPLEYRSLVAF